MQIICGRYEVIQQLFCPLKCHIILSDQPEHFVHFSNQQNVMQTISETFYKINSVINNMLADGN